MFVFLSGKNAKGKTAGVLIAGLAGLSLALSACSAPSSVSPVPDPAPSVASASPVPSESASQEPSTDLPYTEGPVINTTKGKYAQIVLTDNSPFYLTDGAVIDPGVSGYYSEAEVSEGTKAAVDYMLKIIVDPPVIDGELPKDVWWPTVKDSFATQKFADQFYNGLGSINPENGTSDSGPIDNPWWADKEYQGFSYIYDENQTRVKNLSFYIQNVWVVPETGELAISTNISYALPATYIVKAGETPPSDGKLKKATQHTSGTINVSVSKDGSGKWMFTGWDKTVNSPVVTD